MKPVNSLGSRACYNWVPVVPHREVLLRAGRDAVTLRGRILFETRRLELSHVGDRMNDTAAAVGVRRDARVAVCPRHAGSGVFLAGVRDVREAAGHAREIGAWRIRMAAVNCHGAPPPVLLDDSGAVGCLSPGRRCAGKGIGGRVGWDMAV